MLRSFRLLVLLSFPLCYFPAGSALGQEKEATESTDILQDQDQLPETDNQVTESDEDMVLTQQVRAMILNGETRDALTLIETSLGEDPEKYTTIDVQRSYAMVVAGFNRIRSARDVFKTLKRLFEFQIMRLEKKDERVRISGTMRSLLGLAGRLKKTEEVSDIIDRALQATESMAADSDSIQVAVELSNVRGIKALSLIQAEKRDEALAIFEGERNRLKTIFESNPDDELSLAVYLRSLSNVMRLTEDEAQRDALYDEHQSAVKVRLNEKPENMSFATQYLAAILFKAGAVVESDPQKTLELIDEGDKVLSDVVLANADAERALQPIKIQLAAFRKRAEGQLIIGDLIDKIAPELDAEFWVNGDPLDQDDLKGKVIMLDFWAVWCRPCIATFPKIKKLNETYGGQGLEIIGVTNRYNITWDDEKSVPKRGEGEVDAEEEIAAIGKFMEKYELPYPSLVMPEESTMTEDFGVTGIPHVVLIDKKGKIRLVKVGGNDKNAAEIEEKIKELLAE